MMETLRDSWAVCVMMRLPPALSSCLCRHEVGSIAVNSQNQRRVEDPVWEIGSDPQRLRRMSIQARMCPLPLMHTAPATPCGRH